jgi:hypothetical protein
MLARFCRPLFDFLAKSVRGTPVREIDGAPFAIAATPPAHPGKAGIYADG